MIQHSLGKGYKGLKGRLVADDIKEKLGYVALNSEEEEKHYIDQYGRDNEYLLPDDTAIRLGPEVFRHTEGLFRPVNQNYPSIKSCIIDSLAKCDDDIKADIMEYICLTGGTTLLKGFPDRIKNELSESLDGQRFNLVYSAERQFSNWIGGSIVSSLNNFSFMWVSKQEYDEIGNSLEAIDSKCF